MFVVVVADSMPVRGLVSVAAVSCPDTDPSPCFVTGCPESPLQGKVTNAQHSQSWRPAAALAVAATLLAACGGGGSSDVVGGGSQPTAETTLTLVAYSVPEPGWSKVIPAFNASEEGKGVQVTTSYGASGDQSRGVVDGKPADVVNFSVEPDITRLVKAGKVSADWNTDATKGIPFGSVVTLVVRKGNPKNIKDWDDLLRPGVEVVTPSPLSSGSAKWNLLAPVRRQERRRQGHAGGHRLRHQAGQRPRQDCVRDRAAKPPTSSSRAAATC